MVPLPAILFGRIAFLLLMCASQVSEAVAAASGIPAEREGELLPGRTLEVAEGGSGIRSRYHR